jgi:hypothetical protein
MGLWFDARIHAYYDLREISVTEKSGGSNRREGDA